MSEFVKGVTMSAQNDNNPAAEESAAEQPNGPEQSNGSAEIEELQAEIAGLRDRAMRALAEVENVRKRAERERDETRQYAISNFARALLPVADNFGRALTAIPPEARANAEGTLKAVIDGVDAIARQLNSVFEQHGIRLIMAEGQRFDPHLHQAIAEVPGGGKAPGTVVNVVQPGYTIGERLLRPAMVTVAKGDGAAAGGRLDTNA
jgi:molecular chaperone GrpE